MKKTYKPGDKALVRGLEKVVSPHTKYTPGDTVEATLVRQIGPGFWIVQFEGDTDDKGKPTTRIRAIS